MSNVIPTCPHGQNAKACLQCFHAKVNEPREERRSAQSAIPKQPAREPKVQPVPPPNSATAMLLERKRLEAQQKGAQGGVQSAPKPYSYADASNAAYRPDGQWEPPEHESLIDRLPRHPNAEG